MRFSVSSDLFKASAFALLVLPNFLLVPALNGTTQICHNLFLQGSDIGQAREMEELAGLVVAEVARLEEHAASRGVPPFERIQTVNLIDQSSFNAVSSPARRLLLTVSGQSQIWRSGGILWVVVPDHSEVNDQFAKSIVARTMMSLSVGKDRGYLHRMGSIVSYPLRRLTQSLKSGLSQMFLSKAAVLEKALPKLRDLADELSHGLRQAITMYEDQQDATRQVRVSVAGGLIQLDALVTRASQTLESQGSEIAVTTEKIVTALNRVADLIEQRKGSLENVSSFMAAQTEHPATLSDHENAYVTIRLLGSYSINHRVFTEVNLGLQALLAPRGETATPTTSLNEKKPSEQESRLRAMLLIELIAVRVGDDIRSNVNSASVENLLFKLLQSELR